MWWNWRFRKNCKNMFTKQEIVSDVTFKAWLFSFDFNFACKDGWVMTATRIYHCPLVISPTITNCCNSILNVAEFLDASLKTSPCTKTSPVWCKNQSLFLLFQNVAPLSKVILFFSVALYSMMKYFWSAFQMVALNPVDGSKSKLLVKE